jgi:hypothetical protein
MLPDTFVFDNSLLCEQNYRNGTIWALFPTGFSLSRRRTVSLDNLILT